MTDDFKIGICENCGRTRALKNGKCQICGTLADDVFKTMFGEDFGFPKNETRKRLK